MNVLLGRGEERGGERRRGEERGGQGGEGSTRGDHTDTSSTKTHTHIHPIIIVYMTLLARE